MYEKAQKVWPKFVNGTGDQLVSIPKLGILVEIEACEEFYHRHIDNIPRIKF
jgi:hypothetical protein